MSRSPSDERKLVIEELARGEDPYKRLVRESDARVMAKGGTSIFSHKSPTIMVSSDDARKGRQRDFD